LSPGSSSFGSWGTVHPSDPNVVHTLNVVHLKAVPDDRRDRKRDDRRAEFLAAASRVIDERGLDGLTMQALADQMDCAIGTTYTYFRSKAMLVAALEADAVATLLASYRTAREIWDGEIERAVAAEDPDEGLVGLVHLQAFGAFFCAAAVVFGDEFELQRQLLTQRPPGVGADELREVMPVIVALGEVPRGLLDDAVAAGTIEDADNLDRVVRWLAALDGVLLLDHLSGVDRHLFRAQHHGRALTADLLTGWGADRADVEVAASFVDRLAALGPLAPPPSGPGFD
jgi:AcrR family transcriptional regulator